MKLRSLAVFALLAPTPALADIASFRLGPKVAFIRGTGDVYENFEQWVGAGGELGFELLFIDVFAEAFFMSNQQYLFTVNAGMDVNFGSDFRFNAGIYTGPMFYVFPKQQAEPLVVPPEVRAELESAGVNVDRAIQTYNDVAEEEADLSRLAFGWNVARLVLEADVRVAPVVFFGLQSTAGYHYIISGEEVAAGSKNNAIDKVALEYRLSPENQQLLREVVDAREVDTDNLNGLNYSFSLYFRLEI